MLEIKKVEMAPNFTIALRGRLDTSSAPELDRELKASLDGVSSLVLDFTGLEYISSAGLRVIVSAQKIMNEQGTMKLVHVNREIKELFELTGLLNILTIE